MSGALLGVDPGLATITAALIALGATTAAGLIVVTWPRMQARRARQRFTNLLSRELREIGPFEELPDGLPWIQYLTKRFVHEQFLRHENVSEHRDFVLSLNPSVVYLTSQLWIAYDKGDGKQWLHFLTNLSVEPGLGSARLTEAVEEWNRVITSRAEQSYVWTKHGAGAPTSTTVATVPGLFEARKSTYDLLLRELMALDASSVDRLAAWNGEHGLLLSTEAMHRLDMLCAILTRRFSSPNKATAAQADLDAARARLRAALRADLGARHPQERYLSSEAVGAVHRIGLS